MKVKICGITSKEDATWAINYGADYLGLNFYKESPRHISINSSEKWVTTLPSFANLVGVFVNAGADEILHTVSKLNLKGVQLSGDETPDMVAHLKTELAGTGRHVAIFKSFRIQGEESLAALDLYQDSADYFLLDSFVEGEAGGTGTRFNWDLAVQAQAKGKPIFLAGGLTPENVKEAVKKVKPFGVDVASGVEKSPRKKDPEKIKTFIQNSK